jgi:hypothetical protein
MESMVFCELLLDSNKFFCIVALEYAFMWPMFVKKKKSFQVVMGGLLEGKSLNDCLSDLANT